MTVGPRARMNGSRAGGVWARIATNASARLSPKNQATVTTWARDDGAVATCSLAPWDRSATLEMAMT